MIGRTLGPYRITARIGEGGMGAVYRAEDVMLGRDTAIKVLRPELAHDPALIERFRQEARNLARILHPNVAALYGLFEEDGVLFMAMEFAPGESADAMLRRRGALRWTDAARLMTCVLDGLDAAHRRGVIHRDLKPANLIVGGADGVKITDFGIARMLGAARHTRTGAIVGTLAYMAPEQIRGEEGDARTDIYAAGMVLYELLTGAVAFQRTSEYDLMRAVVDEPARAPRAANARIPAWLDAIVVRTLEKDPAARFQSAGEMRAALEAGLTDGAPGGAMLETRVISPTPATRLAIAPVSATRLASAVAPATRLAAAIRTRLAVPQAWTWQHGAAAAAIVVVVTSLGFAALRGEPAPAQDAAAASPDTAVSSGVPAAPALFEPAPARAEPPPAATPPFDDATARRPIGITRPPAATMPEPEPPVRDVPVVEPPPSRAMPPADPSAPAREAPEPTAPEPAAPAPARRAALEPVTFDRIKLLQNVEGKVKEIDARLAFDGDRVRVVDDKSGAELASMHYRAITDATFAQSKHPRWKEGGAAAVAVGVFATPLFFMKGTKHWLTVEAGREFMVLRLDKNNFRLVLPAFEARWGRPVERQVEDR